MSEVRQLSATRDPPLSLLPYNLYALSSVQLNWTELS